MTGHYYNSPEKLKRIEKGIIVVLEDQRGLSCKQIRRKLAEDMNIHTTSQTVSRIIRSLEEDGRLVKLDYGTRCDNWRLA